eukprot:5829308-Amphidinium_carterae.1
MRPLCLNLRDYELLPPVQECLQDGGKNQKKKGTDGSEVMQLAFIDQPRRLLPLLDGRALSKAGTLAWLATLVVYQRFKSGLRGSSRTHQSSFLETLSVCSYAASTK